MRTTRAFAALLDYLAVGPTHLLGFSDGGEVVLLMAAQTPEIARSAVAWRARCH
jgi:valacyclovir hydrolase